MDIKLLHLDDETLISLLAEVALNYVDLRSFQTRLSVAEASLEAQTAQTGVATVGLYPKFSLLGSIGLEALSAESLFLTSSRIHGIGATVAWPLFDVGAIQSNIEVQSALQERALTRYESTVLTALEDVENALVAYAKEQSRR